MKQKPGKRCLTNRKDRAILVKSTSGLSGNVVLSAKLEPNMVRKQKAGRTGKMVKVKDKKRSIRGKAQAVSHEPSAPIDEVTPRLNGRSRQTQLVPTTAAIAPGQPTDRVQKEQPDHPMVAANETGQVPRDADAGIPAKERGSYDGDTAIKLYLREIGQVKLLTPQEEIELAARIKKGDKKAREQMIKANLRLVVKIAHDYEGLGLPLLDLINEGNIGLMKAVERFDPAKGGKLSTYGSWWIKQSIKRALANQSKTIRLPVHLVDKISKMRRTAMKLQEVFGREPTDEELGEELNITAARVAQLRTAAIRPASLDAPIGDDDSNNFAEVVQDENADTPYEQLEEKTVTRMLQEMVKTLDEREATILRYRFGLDGGSEKTLEEVGQKFGVTRERVRQIQNIALAKLRKMIEKLEAVQVP
jgi:RNA polymerase primary sigma factor